ncbi:unnamed protein product [Discosporangium mesarthrocarpum]
MADMAEKLFVGVVGHGAYILKVSICCWREATDIFGVRHGSWVVTVPFLHVYTWYLNIAWLHVHKKYNSCLYHSNIRVRVRDQASVPLIVFLFFCTSALRVDPLL